MAIYVTLYMHYTLAYSHTHAYTHTRARAQHTHNIYSHDWDNHIVPGGLKQRKQLECVRVCHTTLYVCSLSNTSALRLSSLV